MKLATYRPRKPQAPGSGVAAIRARTVVDLNYACARYLRDTASATRAREEADALMPRSMLELLRGGERTLDLARLVTAHIHDDDEGIDGEQIAYQLDDVELLAPISRPGKILAAGKNYADHAAEGAGGGHVEIQPFPRGFVKVSSVVAGPCDDVVMPHVTAELDYEVELAVVIGRAGRYISREKAYDYIAGYTILNDVSARDIQLAESRYGNHLVGKNMDTLSPMGPWIVTRDEVTDPMDLGLQMHVNGELRQDARTSAMIHDIPALIERWSWMTLEPGDVIATGTPGGVALGGKFSYLKVGDVMRCAVEGIGWLQNAIIAEPSGH